MRVNEVLALSQQGEREGSPLNPSLERFAPLLYDVALDDRAFDERWRHEERE